EDVISMHPKIAEVAVVGVPGLYREDVIVAFVVVKEPCTPDEMLLYCRERLANFKIPRSIIFRDELPKSSLGKPLREVLAQSFKQDHLLSSNEGEPVPWRARILACGSEERLFLLEVYLCQVIAEILGVATSKLTIHQHLAMVGIDSLMAIQLKQRLEGDLGIGISLVELLQGFTITQIAAQLLRQINSGTLLEETAPVKIAETAMEYPLSYGQQALWYLYQLAPESAAYNTFFAMRIISGLDVAALHQAFQLLIDRHASLRTVYAVHDGKPVQVVVEHLPVSFEEMSIAGLSSNDLHRLLIDLSHRPFDLLRESPLRVHLLQDSAQGAILLLTAHHIATDFWSMVVLMDELRMFYQAQRDGVEANLAPLALQYTDYTAWEAQLLSSEAGRRAQSYWQDRLADDLPVLDLPVDRPRPPMQTFSGTRHFIELDEDLSWQIREMAKSLGVTLYTVLLAAFQILLTRYSGQDDVLVGSPVTIRSKPEWQNLIGYLVNPVVLRAKLAGNPRFTEFLQNTYQAVIEALDHQEYSFLRLVERIQ